ncbi:NAD(P)-dependent oxidoreductase [Chitinophaga sp. GCM10012297]|uniref:NAD(P)-dependent oxidoreductase n=1 Tax=Chitinophaga chungangae TaxID=2821488 RepID=A0ABS3Y9D6_9BACT|nr:NAD(P)-dependent oxidoreductase [Chitinophaga chungangae]MBO9151289.1 NAD(P)-dependent oxidoreductase [Chitinophaga chungangae]
MAKAFLGMGLLGANFVKAMLEKGEKVQVWNRNPARAQALEASGATVLATAAEAVTGADYVHITVKDDAAVDEVLAAAAPGLKPGAVIIDHTTTTAEGARQRTKEWKGKGFVYLHAPVFMGPANAREGSGFMLVSGNQQVIGQVQPLLEKMTGKLVNLGPEEGKAAGMKLIGNSFLVAFVAGLSDTLSLGKALGISAEDIGSLLGIWNPAQMLSGRLQRLSSGDYNNASWELNMARKDTQIFIDTVNAQNGSLTVLPAIAAQMDKMIGQGFGASDWTVIAKDSIK